ncbi:MAG: DUF6629 family protein, partial [Rhizomicrobium sp.]
AKARKLRQIPLASVPILFAAQQAVEGALWLCVPHGHEAGRLLASLFAMIALVVWPLMMPIAVGLTQEKRRRRWIFALLIPGAGVAAYSLLDVLAHPYLAWPAPLSLVYVNNHPFPRGLIAAYVLAACAPPLLAADPFLKVFGLVVSTGFAVALALFFVSLVSVWCFFAALASLVLAFFFWQESGGGRRSIPEHAYILLDADARAVRPSSPADGAA